VGEAAARLERARRDGLEAIDPTARRRARRQRWLRVDLVTALLLLLLPVPWLHLVGEDPISHAWRLDGRLFVEGQPVDPPGRWSWLAVGRPPLVAELVRDRVLGDTERPPADLRVAPSVRRPALNEPAAAAVGLRQAGREVPMRLLVEASEPLLPGLPERAVISSVEGIELTDRATWERVAAGFDRPRSVIGEGDDGVSFRLRSGRSFTTEGPGLPYARIDTLDLAPEGLQAGITNRLAQLAPVDWFRNLALGSSHGSMVALTTYAQASGRDLAQGRHIAGTGGIRGDGTITRIGGLPAKAAAARRAGADVLFYPASQGYQLEGFDAGNMTLVPIETLEDAIAWLAAPVT
jgi:hypothetical protein